VTRIRLIALAVGAVLGVLAGILMLQHKDAPPEFAPTIPPEPNAANFEQGETITMFDRLTIPSPPMWSGAMSEPETVMEFVDQTNCSGDNAECGRISFINLDSPLADDYFTDDPLQQWIDSGCLEGPAQPLEGPAEFDAGGKEGLFYQMGCGLEGEYNNYAWLIEDGGVLVAAHSGEAGIVEPAIVQAALMGAVWR